ncbi:hypothetical protein ABIA38_005538 [Embleya sp. AB8]
MPAQRVAPGPRTPIPALAGAFRQCPVRGLSGGGFDTARLEDAVVDGDRAGRGIRSVSSGLVVDCGEHRVVVTGCSGVAVDVAVGGAAPGLGDAVSHPSDHAQEFGVEARPAVVHQGQGGVQHVGGECLVAGLGIGDVEVEEFGDGLTVQAGGGVGAGGRIVAVRVGQAPRPDGRAHAGGVEFAQQEADLFQGVGEVGVGVGGGSAAFAGELFEAHSTAGALAPRGSPCSCPGPGRVGRSGPPPAGPVGTDRARPGWECSSTLVRPAGGRVGSVGTSAWPGVRPRRPGSDRTRCRSGGVCSGDPDAGPGHHADRRGEAHRGSARRRRRPCPHVAAEFAHTVHGRYRFALPAEVADGRLRRTCKPSDADTDPALTLA